jgi:transposase
VVEHKLEHCPHCAFALADVEMLPPMERQVFDIPPPRLWVTSHQSEVKKCPRRERTSHASFPEDVAALVGILGILMHDHWKTYYSNEVFKGNAHGLCNAHHLRELKAVAELDGDRWARHVRLLLRFALHVMHANQGVVPLPLAERIVTLYHTLLERAVAMYEARPPFDAKGRAKRIGHNLALRLLQRDADTLRFMGEKDVPFTNNQAEQDLRMMKVKQKISGGFRTVEGAKAFARIRSFIGTAIKQTWNVLDAIAHPALHEVKLE